MRDPDKIPARINVHIAKAMQAPPQSKPLSLPMALAIAAAVAALTYLLIIRPASNNPVDTLPRTFHFLSMGTVASATFYCGADADAGSAIVAGAFNEVEANLSVFSPTSLISRLNASGALVLETDKSKPGSPTDFDFSLVVTSAYLIARDTDGAFDPTVNPLMRLWGFRDGKPQEPPSEASIAEALGRTGWKHIFTEGLHGSAIAVSLRKPGMELDLGGIAKGYAVDLAFERLRAAGLQDFMIDLGGNIRVSGRPEPGRDFWRVAIRNPDNPSMTTGETIMLTNGQAVATSGSYERFIEIGGKRYSHIIDPRTGHPVVEGGSTTVVAPCALLADGYSTAFFVIGRRGVFHLPGNVRDGLGRDMPGNAIFPRQGEAEAVPGD